MSDTKTKHYIINYNDITNIPFIDIDSEKLQVINNKLTTIYADTNLKQGKNTNISSEGFINVTNTFINDNDINKIYYNGNVGIGTTNPASLLNIYDSINNSNLLNISENGLILDTNINVIKNNIELGSDVNKVDKIYCNYINDIDTSFLTEDNLKNNIFYTRSSIDGITANITTQITSNSTADRWYTTEIFTNSSNYTNEEIVQVTSELKTYSDTQISSALNNSSNYSEELFTNSSNYNTELFTNSSNYIEELSINSSNYIDNEISRVSGDVISNAFDTNIRTELPELVITEEITSLRSETKSVANIIGNYNDTSGIILTANNTDNYKSFIILKSVNSSSSVKIYNYDNDNLLISTNDNDMTSPTVILNERKMILGYDTSEYFGLSNTELYNSINTLEIKGDINITGNLKKNNETINLNIWSTQTNNVNYIADIIFKDSNNLTNTSYVNGSLVTIAGDLSLNKQGLIIEKYDRTQRIGITDCSIKQLGNSANAKLSITSKGNLPVSIGNEINDTLQIYENRALLSGDVGIGTTTPNYKLDVNGDINFTGNLTKGGNPFTLYSDTDVRALLNSGNVGIGTSTPNYKLDVNGDINFTGNLTKGGNPLTSYSDTDVRALLNSGNVGIGTSTPNYKLDVNGDINFTGNLTKTIISTDPVIVPNVSINDNVSFKTVIFENTGDEQTIYTVHFPKDTICDILVIGGGGGGGGGEVQGTGGGGGAGGLIYKTNQTLSGTYNILVGKGGLGMEYSSTTMVNNNNGRDSGIYDSSNNVLYLTKGGGAGGARATNGASGGSGGGGGGGNSITPGTGALPINSGPYIHSIGNSGGGGNKYAKGGGGGGAGGQGSLATGDRYASGAAGNGGLPKIVDITGENRAYAGGGGGGAWQVAPGEGGSVVIDGQIVKVGGDGGYNIDEIAPGNGVPHTGSGGGGAKHYAYLGTPQNAGNGGSGIVIIRYSTETIENVSYSDDKVENILANLDTHIVPSVDETIDIGSVDKKIRDIYVNKLDVNGDINFTGNLTKGGNPFTSYSDTYVRALLNSGNVGIGIASNCPNNAMVIDSDGMVDLNTNNNSVTILDFTSYNRAGGGQGGSGTHALSMKTNKGINIQYGYSLIVSSSRKIKKEETDLEDGECLQICMGLKPKKYKMIDDRLHGNDYRYGFIAEELEEVLPHAVQSHEQLIPNIYDDATIINNDTIEITKDLEIGVEYTIYNSNEYDKVETEYKMNILEILGNNLYRVDLDMSTMYGGSIFIYGKIDNDVKQLKKDNLFPILTSSVQELHSMIQNQQTQINQLLEILSRNGIS